MSRPPQRPSTEAPLFLPLPSQNSLPSWASLGSALNDRGRPRMSCHSQLAAEATSNHEGTRLFFCPRLQIKNISEINIRLSTARVPGTQKKSASWTPAPTLAGCARPWPCTVTYSGVSSAWKRDGPPGGRAARRRVVRDGAPRPRRAPAGALGPPGSCSGSNWLPGSRGSLARRLNPIRVLRARCAPVSRRPWKSKSSTSMVERIKGDSHTT